ncbi:MAG: thiopeptide-type bacteriocin biosynthesis protein [Dermatophilaceae bacterium]
MTATTRVPSADDRGWRSWHLFVHGDRARTDRVLLEIVHPLVRDLQAAGTLAGWFFVRYWHGGPHLRLRLRGLAAGHAAEVDRRLRDGLDTLTPVESADRASFYSGFDVASDPVPTVDLGWYADRELVGAAYHPEVDRYGGPGALAAAERLFETSSEVAVVVLRTVPDAHRRRGVCLDLIHGLTRIQSEDAAHAIRWCRDYAAMWRHLSPRIAMRHLAIQQAAEADHCASAKEHLDRAHLVQRWAALVTGGDGADVPALHRAWLEAVRAYLDELAALDRAGDLVGTPSTVAVSQVHMLHNRLGESAAEEVRLAELCALNWAGVTSPSRFHDDGAGAADRRYLQDSKFRSTEFVEAQMPRWRPASAAPATSRAAWSGPSVELPPSTPSTMPLVDALARRRTARGRMRGDLTLQRLSSVLEESVRGIRRTYLMRDRREYELIGRPYPSAGMAYSTRFRVLSLGVEGLEPGVYDYDADAHALTRVGDPVSLTDVMETSAFFREPEPWIDLSSVGVVIALFVDITEMRRRYGLRTSRFAMLEAGHAAQAFTLACTAHGVESALVGGFFDDTVCALVHLDGWNELPMYLIPLSTAVTTASTEEEA